ncbi:MAG: C-GCAxxG-C-C family protein [Eubacteriales bacterium]
MGIKAKAAEEYFLKGANCSQAVLAAFHQEAGMDMETALKIASSFGAGMGRLREVCGALSAVFMIAGFQYGYSDLDDADAKAAHYKLIQDLAREFKEKNGSILCRGLLGLDEAEQSWVPETRSKSYYENRPCLEIVKNTADMIETYMNKNKK